RREGHVPGNATERFEDRDAHLEAVRRSAARVEDEHFRIARDSSAGNQLLSDGESGAAFGRGVDARHPADLLRGLADCRFAYRVRVTAAFLHGPENEPVTKRT